jgi:hypothetical protein
VAKWRGYDEGFWVDEPPDDDIIITTADHETPLTVARMEGDHARGLAELWANAGPETLRLVAEVRRLTASLAAATQAFDDLVAHVRRVRPEPLPAGHVAVDRALYEAACRLAADVPRLQREVASARREGAVAAWGVAFDALGAPMPPEANGTGEYEVATVARTVRSVVAAERDVARREGAEAMREACAAECEGWAAVHDARETMHGALGRVDEFGIDIAYEAATARAHWRDASAALRALPLPGGEP